MQHDALSELKQKLEGLDWSGGLTRDDLREQITDFPEVVYLHLPGTKKFASPLRLIQYLIVVAARLRADTIPPEGVEELGGPDAWGQAMTGRSFHVPDLTHGVGSGLDAGNTGSGSTQTGTGPSGTTYGEGYQEID
ncbi:MAG: hypothetical protein EPO21_19850 [Chloroflexota bacterium]|nr:MAG: hypothetical protein EPO21_19850 [Chloroflexota bacterium]